MLVNTAHEAIQDLGYSDKSVVHIHGYENFPHVFTKGLTFWYRQRPTNSDFAQHSFWSSRWGLLSRARADFQSPPFVVPGEINVILTGDKQLEYFCVKPSVEKFSDNAVVEPNWSDWFNSRKPYFDFDLPSTDENKSVNGTTLQRVDDSWWAPPVFSDSRAVWRGTDPKDGRTFLIEAAALRGQLVYFHKIDLEEFEQGQLPIIERNVQKYPVPVVIYLVLLIFGILLAGRNMRTGNCDWNGGFKLAIYIFTVSFGTLLGYCHVPSRIEPFTRTVVEIGAAQALFETARMWIWYMALEPYVRRYWPQILITSSRLMEGRGRDPLFGRDLLAGVFAGLLATIAWKINDLVYLATDIQFDYALMSPTLVLSGGYELIGSLFAAHNLAIFIAFFLLVCLLLNRVLLGSKTYAQIATVFVTSVIVSYIAASPNPFVTWVWVPALLSCAIALFVLVRFGIVAMVAYSTCRHLTDFFPLTTDRNNWYFDYGMFAGGVIILIALIGFYLASPVKNDPVVLTQRQS